jgi:hypothetical protein
MTLLCPDTPDDRFKANTMLVHAPQLYLGCRIGVPHLLDLDWQFTLERLLLGRIGLVVTRALDLKREACPLESFPAALGVDFAPKLLPHPCGDFGTSPKTAIGRCLCQDLL